MKFNRMISASLLLAMLPGCSPYPAPKREEPAEALSAVSAEEARWLPRKLNCSFLPNPVQLHEDVISGGLPEGPEAFQELADLGIRTVISVDGAKPDVDTARTFGLRYVHLPHSYDGIPEARAQQLAKAIRDLDGPIYVHCHHGKHRSPAAASVACVGAGLLAPAAALSVLKLAGTSENYRGLYRSAAGAQVWDSKLLDSLQVTFQETVAVPPLAEAMVQLEHVYHQVQQIADADWKAPAAHPDLDAAHQALLLRERFTEMLRTPEVQQQPASFQQLLKTSEAAAQELETELHQQSNHRDPDATESLTNLLNSITKDCKSCHVQYRDIPLDEK